MIKQQQLLPNGASIFFLFSVCVFMMSSFAVPTRRLSKRKRPIEQDIEPEDQPTSRDASGN